ncbi:Alpha-protein kinase vwkA (von Willebrand factor A alpha-kinase) (vWF kinase) [Durusdinium trenchii]|uniref:Alpha-protein kinase vwkA (von Willebrand factor A alpha-kinase) (vWF kinase) n=1 Tax=Durusdinium trenchii TaxID=1381693 RepID=A0ABP0LJD0_9DINO
MSAVSKVIQLLLVARLCSLSNGGQFIEIQGVSDAPGTPLGSPTGGSSAVSCKNACLQEVECDCVVYDPIHSSCKMQSDCLYFHPDFQEGGPLELHIKLPQRLQHFSVFPGTTANSDSRLISGKEADSFGTEMECADRCTQNAECQCVIIQSQERWSSSKNHCWMRSNCQPGTFQRDQSTVTIMTLMKDAPGQAGYPFISVDDGVGSAPTSGSGGSPVGIIIAVLLILALLAAVALLVLCYLRTQKWQYRAILQDLSVPKEDGPRKEYAKEELQKSFDSKNALTYLGSLELALDAKLQKEDIPCVYSIQKVPETFRIPKVDAAKTSLTVQLCFILDYTGSMKTQISQTKDSVAKIAEAMQKLQITSMPNAKVEVEMTAIAYNDWDPDTKKKGRPVVAVFGGQEIKNIDHDESLPIESFDLGHGGKIPEELTGGLLAASHLEWTAEEKLAIVITDAPCHGKEYSTADHDPFCNKETGLETGLTCTGKPEVPLRGLMDKGVTTVILHTGESDAETMCQKLAQTDPNLISYKVSASDTAKKVIAVLEDKVQVQPLTYVLKPLRLEDHPPQGQLLCDSIRVSDVASGHDLEVAVGKEKTTHSIGADGLLFVGKSSQNPMITLSRPVDKDLDGWFEDKSLEVELDRYYTPSRVYSVKMPPKTAKPE